MKCVIIGLGWLGKPLAIQLSNLGFEVVGSTRNEVFTSEDERFERFVFRPNEDLSNTTIEHLKSCAVLVFAFPPSRESEEVYAQTCLNLISYCAKNVNVILVSSTGVYPNENRVFSEKDKLPSASFTSSLDRCEFQLSEVLSNRLTIIRMAGLVGENRYPARFMSSSGKEYAAEEPVNLIHQTDAVGLVVHCIVNSISGKIINGCSSIHPTKKDYYSWMSSQLNISAPLFIHSEKGGKTIDSTLSKSLGFVYTFNDPFDFPIK